MIYIYLHPFILRRRDNRTLTTIHKSKERRRLDTRFSIIIIIKNNKNYKKTTSPVLLEFKILRNNNKINIICKE
jgi:hypothetical protein